MEENLLKMLNELSGRTLEEDKERISLLTESFECENCCIEKFGDRYTNIYWTHLLYCEDCVPKEEIYVKLDPQIEIQPTIAEKVIRFSKQLSFYYKQDHPFDPYVFYYDIDSTYFVGQGDRNSKSDVLGGIYGYFKVEIPKDYPKQKLSYDLPELEIYVSEKRIDFD